MVAQREAHPVEEREVRDGLDALDDRTVRTEDGALDGPVRLVLADDACLAQFLGREVWRVVLGREQRVSIVCDCAVCQSGGDPSAELGVGGC